MTISTTTAKSRYAGDGGTTAFPTGFKFLDADHVRVVLRAADGSETVWTEGSEYSLTGAGAAGGGTVEVSTSPVDHTPAVGETLVVKLAIPPRQETALPLGGAFPSTAVEAMADLAALRDQQIEEALSRTVKFKETTALAEVAFPDPEAGKLVAWSGDGTALENVERPGDGADGASILFGLGAPAGALGGVGDCYKDTATSDFYEKTGASAWTLRGNDRGLQGEPGAPGMDGTDGADGADGAGVPSGGSTGQVLRKASGTDYHTEWSNPGAAPVDSVFGRTGVVVGQPGDYSAGQITNTPTGTIAATTVQAAINELDSEKLAASHAGSGGGAHATAVAGGAAGFMSGADKTKLDGIASGAQVNPAAPTQVQAEDGSNTTLYGWSPQRVHQAAKDAVPFSLIVAVGDEATELIAGTAKVTFRLPHAVTLTAVRASLTTVSSSGGVTVDINEGGATILSTKLSIDANEKTSATAAAPAIISDGALADDAEITIDIDASGTGATGLKVALIGYKTTT